MLKDWIKIFDHHLLPVTVINYTIFLFLYLLQCSSILTFSALSASFSSASSALADRKELKNKILLTTYPL